MSRTLKLLGTFLHEEGGDIAMALRLPLMGALSVGGAEFGDASAVQEEKICCRGA